MVRGWESRLFGHMSVAEAFQRYLADCLARQFRQESLRKYQLMGRELTEQFPSRSVDSLDIQICRHIRRCGSSHQSPLGRRLNACGRFFNFCIERKWTDENPSKFLKPPRVPFKPTLPVEDADFEKLIAACKGRERVGAFLLMLRYSGLRIQDCVRLKRSAVVNGELFPYSAKTSVPVSMPLPDFVVSELMKWGGEYFFWTGVGTIRTAVGNWQRALERVGKVAGVKYDAHQLRDSFAVGLLSKGVSLENVATLLGNSPAICFRHYSPWVRSRQDALASEVRRTFT
jgi:site-specific recombinase XerD